MSHETTTRRDRHRDVELMLPWWCDGTLTEAEQALVAEHLEECDICREEAGWLRQLRDAVRAEGEIAPAPTEARVERLLDRLDEEADERVTDASRDLRSPSVPVRSRGARAWPWIVAAQAAALVAMAVMLVTPPTGPLEAGAYETLSDPPSAASAATVELSIVFEPTATESEIRQLVRSTGGEIVAGPTALGVYRVRLGAEADDPVVVVLDHFRGSSSVRFAELRPGSVAAD